LRRRFGAVQISNYRGHGGGAFLDRGYSLDLFLPGRDARGFYRPEDAIRLARAIAAAARVVGANWRVIYNDFAVAQAVNREFRRSHVIFVGGVRRDRAKRVAGLNWHGPDPLILHFHLDLAPNAGAALGEAERFHEETYESGPFETGETHACAACAARSETYAAEWVGEQAAEDERYDQAGEDEQEAGRFDEQEQAWEGFDTEASELASAGLSPAERKALEITSTLETGKRGGFSGLSGNFDGQGLSFGLVNWTIGTGSLQPLLRDFARENPARWSAIFGVDAERFLRLILPKGEAATRDQHRFAVEEMNVQQVVRGRTRWAIKAPWRGYFEQLSQDPAFRQIQIRYVRDLLTRAADFCRLFGLKSEQAFAFMFDAVSSHGKWWLTKKFGGVEKRRLMIEARRAPLQAMSGGRLPEQQVLLIIADVLAETSAPRWAAKVRARKRWFVTGEHPRAKELAGLAPRADVAWSASTPAPAHEDEDLAWLAYEQPTSQAEWQAGEDEDFADFTDERDEAFADSLDEAEFRPSPLFLESVQEADGGRESHEGYEAFLLEGSGFEGFEAPGDACVPYTPAYEKLIRQKGSRDGEVVDRTTGDRATTLSLQFRDYDVNAYLPTKSAHSAGLGRLTDFIQSRTASGAAVEVTFTGSASKTGTQAFNQALSEKRAHCLAQMLRVTLHPATLAKCTFNERGDGFSNATCNGADCELPGFRSVLVSVHAPNRPPPPVPPEPDTWDKYEIRCCAFQSLSLGEVVIDELLNKLPGGMPRVIAEKLAPALRKRLEAALKRLLKRLPKLGALGGDISKLLKFLPIEATRQKAVFQVRERGKPGARQITLCYDGWGGRLALPIPGKLDDALDELLKKIPGIGSSDALREPLKKLIKEELEALLPQKVTKLMAKMDSTTPGPWKAFDLNRREKLEVFRGPADIFIDAITNLSASGQLFLGFEGPRWKTLNLARRVAMKIDGTETSVIALTVDGGVGFDLLSVNKGDLIDQGCSCAPEASTELFAELA
jgi:hypothetical protein